MRTDPAALAAAEELAARHGLRLAGFDTSGITGPTVHEIAAALDETLGKFPFLELGGLAIAELSGGVSRVRYEYAGGPGAWIVLDRAAVADPAGLPARVGTPARSGDLSRVFAAQPMYATIVADLGQVAAAAAGPRTSRLVQRTLIGEYHRVSGPWDRGDTLAAVTRGYRRWRAQLSGTCFTGGRLDPRATSAESFAEVELCGAGACGPAKAVHRLVVERARARSDH
ncbi:hypothetical protein NMK54_35435 [Nocardia otitidiscaviarum]|uniref:hypothetical protein n=1 Tax=Nocardia otitidiscaviarum TaxID=1823 RepID=UPI00163D63EC|nr:hypothetical protein [Nocardia otitidiscaviarum]MCP9625438.1 hypothetical protein [Nocardia otitidiscaviarum]